MTYDWRAYCHSRHVAAPLAKDTLKDQAYYAGRCRNATVAQWHADKAVFTYWRTKFGARFIEEIRHPEDDAQFDVFIPVREATASEQEAGVAKC